MPLGFAVLQLLGVALSCRPAARVHRYSRRQLLSRSWRWVARGHKLEIPPRRSP
jgi:hypothetical protein